MLTIEEKVDGKVVVQNTEEIYSEGIIYNVRYFSNGESINFNINHQRDEGKEKLLSLVYEKISYLVCR